MPLSDFIGKWLGMRRLFVFGRTNRGCSYHLVNHRNRLCISAIANVGGISTQPDLGSLDLGSLDLGLELDSFRLGLGSFRFGRPIYVRFSWIWNRNV